MGGFGPGHCVSYLRVKLKRGADIVAVLGETLADKTDRVRRRAMATLGELLFYVATQQTDAAQVPHCACHELPHESRPVNCGLCCAEAALHRCVAKNVSHSRCETSFWLTTTRLLCL